MISPETIFNTSIPFEEKVLDVFRYQQKNNSVYRCFCQALEIEEVSSIKDIPLLPIEAFKEAEVLTNRDNSKFKIQNLKFFQSSGTTGMQRSRHYLLKPEIYRQSILRGMRQFYELDDYVIWAYTPGYSDNPHSSLIHMLKLLIDQEASGMSRFLELGKPLDQEQIREIKKSEKKLMLFGAAFGLLDLLELYPIELPEDTIILETGGMKTHWREITKEMLHQKLADGFSLPEAQIHSEYGMCELLSQAYAQGGLWFESVPWMQMSIRDPEDPMEILPTGEEGLIGVMDLANVHSCSFILTGDKGVQRSDGAFQVLGRWKTDNLRGCNFLIDRD